MARFNPPAPFSFKPNEWPEWLDEFARFRIATTLHKEEGDVQRDSLLCVIHERCVFQSRQQLANESVEDFARELQTLAVHCERTDQRNGKGSLWYGSEGPGYETKTTVNHRPEPRKAMTIAKQLEQDQHVAEASVSPSPRTAGRHTASKYRYST